MIFSHDIFHTEAYIANDLANCVLSSSRLVRAFSIEIYPYAKNIIARYTIRSAPLARPNILPNLSRAWGINAKYIISQVPQPNIKKCRRLNFLLWYKSIANRMNTTPVMMMIISNRFISSILCLSWAKNQIRSHIALASYISIRKHVN